MTEPSFYDSDRALSEYLLFHYGSAEEVLPNAEGPRAALHYPVRCVSDCVDVKALKDDSRALELGCSVGRSSFELSRLCREVVGIDYSQRFVEAAEIIRTRGVLAYERIDEGDLSTRLEARLPCGVHPERVRFLQGDALDVPEHLGSFDVILAVNLVDRLSEPKRFLQGLAARTRPGGQLILSSPYTWSELYTEKPQWLGGRVFNDVEMSSLDGIQSILSESFTLVETKDIPFLIREHVRKYQWSVAQASVWKRI